MHTAILSQGLLLIIRYTEKAPLGTAKKLRPGSNFNKIAHATIGPAREVQDHIKLIQPLLPIARHDQ